MAILWLTVLGFDNITLGYCKQQGVTESVLGVLTGVSALVGVAGTRLYPYLLTRWVVPVNYVILFVFFITVKLNFIIIINITGGGSTTLACLASLPSHCV